MNVKKPEIIILHSSVEFWKWDACRWFRSI